MNLCKYLAVGLAVFLMACSSNPDSTFLTYSDLDHVSIAPWRGYNLETEAGRRGGFAAFQNYLTRRVPNPYSEEAWASLSLGERAIWCRDNHVYCGVARPMFGLSTPRWTDVPGDIAARSPTFVGLAQATENMYGGSPVRLYGIGRVKLGLGQATMELKLPDAAVSELRNGISFNLLETSQFISNHNRNSIEIDARDFQSLRVMVWGLRSALDGRFSYDIDFLGRQIIY